MKTLFQYLLAILPALLLTNCSGTAQSGETAIVNAPDRIEVLDFHTDHRCKTCLTIEKLTKEVLSQSFTDQMDKGVLTFQLINVDQEENLPIAQKFGAFGTSLMLNVIRNGQEKQVDLTDFAFMTANDEENFKQELKEKINTELKSLQL